MARIPGNQSINRSPTNNTRSVVPAPSDPRPQAEMNVAQRELSSNVNQAEAIGGAITTAGQLAGEAASRWEDNTIFHRMVDFENSWEQRLLEARENIDPTKEDYAKQFEDEFFNEASQFVASLPETKKNAADRQLRQFQQQSFSQLHSWASQARGDLAVTALSQTLDGLKKSYMNHERDAAGNVISGRDFQSMYDRGVEAIRISPLDTVEKRQAYINFDKQSAEWLAQKEIEIDVRDAVVQLRSVTTIQGRNYQEDKLFSAVVAVESSGNPTAVNERSGAVGLMQVLPETAKTIAKEIDDTDFPTNGSIEEITEYLKRPGKNREYGEYYLKKQLDTFGDNETALVAYNAGPGNARKWLNAGRDYSVLPMQEETEPYVKRILDRITTPPPFQFDFGSNVMTKGIFISDHYSWNDIAKGKKEVDFSLPGVLDSVTDALGYPLKLTKRDGARERSLSNAGVVVDVSGLSSGKKTRITALLTKSGAKRVEQNGDRILVDWGEGDGVFKIDKGSQWFTEGVETGLGQLGTIITTKGPNNPIFARMDHDRLEFWRDQANKAWKSEVEAQLPSEIMSIEETGQGTGELQMPFDRQIMDEEMQLDYDIAQPTHQLLQQLKAAPLTQQMAIAEAARPAPGAPNYDKLTKIYERGIEYIQQSMDEFEKDPAQRIIDESEDFHGGNLLADQWKNAIASNNILIVNQASIALMNEQRAKGIEEHRIRPYTNEYMQPLVNALNDKTKDHKARTEPVIEVIKSWQNPADQRKVFAQMHHLGLADGMSASIRAAMRGDDKASRHIAEAALADRAEMGDEDNVDIRLSVDEVFGLGGVGHAYYTLGVHNVANRAWRDMEYDAFYKSAVLYVRDGMSVDAAVNQTVKDFFNDGSLLMDRGADQFEVYVPPAHNSDLIYKAMTRSVDTDDYGSISPLMDHYRKAMEATMQTAMVRVRADFANHPDGKAEIANREGLMKQRIEYLTTFGIFRSVGDKIGLYIPDQARFVGEYELMQFVKAPAREDDADVDIPPDPNLTYDRYLGWIPKERPLLVPMNEVEQIGSHIMQQPIIAP